VPQPLLLPLQPGLQVLRRGKRGPCKRGDEPENGSQNDQSASSVHGGVARGRHNSYKA
jgi:hypothetical protein